MIWEDIVFLVSDILQVLSVFGYTLEADLIMETLQDE